MFLFDRIRTFKSAKVISHTSNHFIKSNIIVRSYGQPQCIFKCFSFQCLTNLCWFSPSFLWRYRVKYNENLLPTIAHSAQLFVYDDEKPYASATTHFFGWMISKSHFSLVKDIRNTGDRFSFSRIAHLGEIWPNDKGCRCGWWCLLWFCNWCWCCIFILCCSS